MDFHTILENVKIETEKDLTRFFQEKKVAMKDVDPHVVPVVEHIADFTLRGGKRMRAFLCWLGYSSMLNEINSSPDTKYQILNTKLLDVMVSLELFQSFALIHDDIIDKDTTRRGGPTVHEMFNSKSETRNPASPAGGSKTDATHFGTSMAILAGDLVLAWADEQMNKTNFRAALDLYQHMKEEVILGQSLDVLSQFGQADINKSKIDELKTAWYSVVRPLQIGAALAGGDKNHLENLVGFGVPVGKLFQLGDDHLDGDISTLEFKHESAILKMQSEKALDNLSVPEDWKRMFDSLITFVLTRTA